MMGRWHRPRTSPPAERRGPSSSAREQGDRLGADRPKAFVRFRDSTMLASSLAVLDDHEGIDGIVCVVPEGYEDRATLVVDDLLADKVSAAVAGGETRARSVAAGLEAVPGTAAFVLVHDAARPLVTPRGDRSRDRGARGGRGGRDPGCPARGHRQAGRGRTRDRDDPAGLASSWSRHRRASPAQCLQRPSPPTLPARPTVHRSPR